MLRAESERNEPCLDATQRCKARHQLKKRRRLRAGAPGQNAMDQPIMEKRLQPLSRTGRKHAPFLNLLQMVRLHRSRLERLPQNVRRCHRVLDGKINAHAAQGRHGMRGVADAKETAPMPVIKPVKRNSEKPDLLPVLELVEAVRELRHQPSKGLTKCR